MAGLTAEQQRALGQKTAGGGLNTRRHDAHSPEPFDEYAPLPSNKEVPQFNSLHYPADLSNSEISYPDCIRFTVMKRIGMSIKDATTLIGNAYKAFNRALKTGSAKTEGEMIRVGIPADIAKSIINSKSGSGTEQEKQLKTQAIIEKYNTNNPQNPITKDALGAFVNAMQRTTAAHNQRKLAYRNQQDVPLGSIYLNMPNGIQFNEAANWGGQELGFMGKTTKDWVGGEDVTQDLGTTAKGAIIGSAGNIMGAAIGGLPALVSKLGISGSMFGMAIGAMAAGGPIQKGAEAALAISQNPYMEMMFSGIGFRKFAFDFILRPRNQTEVNVVKDILTTFRQYSKPDWTEQGIGKTFMNYPMEFHIGFLTASPGGDGWVPNDFLPKLKTCVCDNVTSNYTPQSIWAAYKQGKPVAVSLNLSFQETELIMSEEVKSGF